MARGKKGEENEHASTISLIGPGMHLVGDCSTEGTLRIEGSVKGTIYAGKAVVVGKDGTVEGDIRTQDAVISGTVTGALHIASRLEVQATSRIEGTVHTRRLQLEEGAVLNGDVQMGEVELGVPPSLDAAAGRSGPAEEGHDGPERHAPEHGERPESGPGHEAAAS